MTERATVDFQRGIRRWTSMGDNISYVDYFEVALTDIDSSSLDVACFVFLCFN